MKGETESLMTVAPNQALSKCYHQRNIIKQPTDRYRMCCKAEDHTKHAVVRCTTFAPSAYTNRHSKAAGYIHWPVCEHVGLQVTGRDCEHVSEMVMTVNGTAIMCDLLGITDGKTFANRTDRVLHDKWEKTCLLIDIAIPDESTVSTEETKKISAKNWTSRSAECGK